MASFVRTEGLMAFAETEWLRLNVPLIFRTFWLMRCLIYFVVYAIASPSIESVFDRDSLISLFKIMLVRGCETLPAILGMSSIFSWISGKVFFFSFRNHLSKLYCFIQLLAILIDIYNVSTLSSDPT